MDSLGCFDNPLIVEPLQCVTILLHPANVYGRWVILQKQVNGVRVYILYLFNFYCR